MEKIETERQRETAYALPLPSLCGKGEACRHCFQAAHSGQLTGKGTMPKDQSSVYREYETRERASAAGSALEHVAAMHLRAAAKWAELAVRQEKIERGL